MAHVRFAARDPGGANVLTGFLARRPADARFTFDVWSLPQASPVFRRGGISPREFAEAPDRREVAALWSNRPADALVTGTSHYAPFEPLLWSVARHNHCPSLAVNDAWGNLEQRFATERPDFVGAVDAGQVADLIRLGFGSGQVITTGHPWLSFLIERREHIARDTVIPPRHADVHVLFASECIASDVAQGVTPRFGFDEFDAFMMLYRAAVAATSTGLTVSVAVKFHPYEDPKAFLDRLRRLAIPAGLSIRHIEGADKPYPWVLWSDLTAGIGSTLLLEAIVLGRPVVSLQPGLSRENTFVAGRRGLAPLTDQAAGGRVLTGLLCDAAARRALFETQRPFVDTIPTDPVTPIMNWISERTPGKSESPEIES